VLCSLAAVLLALGRPALAAEAARIDRIDPSCASAGEEVTITGIGFGGANVKVAVGGVSARALTASGDRATFSVPAAAPLGPTTVTATNPGGQTGRIAFEVCDLRLPASWAGRWEITIAYRDATTDSLVAVDEGTDPLCSGDSFGFTSFDDRARCTGMVSDTRLEIRCSSEFAEGSCSISGTFELEAERDGDTLAGAGEWSAAVMGDCGPAARGGERLDIAGARLGMEPDGCEERSSLALKLLTHPSLVGLLE
jgi:hypothetical protein